MDLNTTQIDQQTKFNQNWLDFLTTKEIIKGEFVPAYNAFNLYKLACRCGGSQAITNRNQWPQICSEIGGNDPYKVKKFYLRYLFAYEKKNYFGKQNQDQLPNLICSLPRKMVKTEYREQKTKQQGNLLLELARTIEQQDRAKKQFFLNKNKLISSKVQSKKIMLGLEAYMGRRDVIYSLNMLMLYSVNSHFPFLFENHQKIFTALSSYTQSIYPPTCQQMLEDLRTITLILRNLTMNPINLKYMLGTPMFQLLVNIFNTGLDHQCSRNIVDIMNGLVKVGWDCQRILKDIHTAVLEGKTEDVQNGVEMLKGLVDQRDETLASAFVANMKSLTRVLLSSEISNEIKQQTLEILAFVTDISSQTREQFLKNEPLLSLIIGILQHMRNQQKMIQFAALTLSNISTSTGAKHYLKPYESDLMMIGFTDDSLAGIIANILSDIAAP